MRLRRFVRTSLVLLGCICLVGCPAAGLGAAGGAGGGAGAGGAGAAAGCGGGWLSAAIYSAIAGLILSLLIPRGVRALRQAALDGRKADVRRAIELFLTNQADWTDLSDELLFGAFPEGDRSDFAELLRLLRRVIDFIRASADVKQQLLDALRGSTVSGSPICDHVAAIRGWLRPLRDRLNRRKAELEAKESNATISAEELVTLSVVNSRTALLAEMTAFLDELCPP